MTKKETLAAIDQKIKDNVNDLNICKFIQKHLYDIH